MEKLNNKSKTSLPSVQTLSPALSTIANQIRDAYGDFVSGFCGKHFGKDARMNFPTLVSACMTRTPSFVQTDLAYGEGSAQAWMYAQLSNTLGIIGLFDNALTEEQIMWCINNLIMMGKPHCVTVAEMIQFFSRFEQGKYEKFYGSKNVNPQVITQSFNTFLEDLDTARITAERERISRLNQYKANVRKATSIAPSDEFFKGVNEHITNPKPFTQDDNDK